MNFLKEKTHNRFIIYTRCSTDDQSKGDYTTLDAQAHHCKNLLDALGYEFVRVASDDGFSGKDLNRPGIQSILREINANKQQRSFDGVIFFRLDRLTRNPRDLYALVDLFNEHNIAFVSVRENLDSSTAIGRVIIGILGSLSAFEREMTGERVKASAAARVRQGRWVGGILPFGYKRLITTDGAGNSQTTKIILDEELAPKVRMIWEMAADNKSLMAIGRELESRGIKSPKGNSWRKQSLLTIIKNPFYKGYVKWAQEMHKGQHEALVDSELWEKANRILVAKMPGHRFTQKPKTYIFYLEGLMKCGKCGSSMITTHSIGQRKGKFHYYICGRRKQGLGCDSSAIPAKTFDEALVKYFRDASTDRDVILKAIEGAVIDARNKLQDIDKDLGKYENQLACLKEEAERLLELAMNGTISKGTTYKERMEKVENGITGLEERISQIRARKRAATMSKDSDEYIRERLMHTLDQFDKVSPEEQKGLIQALIKRIDVFDDHIHIVMPIDHSLAEKLPTANLSHKKAHQNEKAEPSFISALTENQEGSALRQFTLPGEGSNLGPTGYKCP